MPSVSVFLSFNLLANYLASFLQFRNYKIVYRRYAGLFFCVCVDANDNELAYLEAIHLFVEILGTFELSKPGRGQPTLCTQNRFLL